MKPVERRRAGRRDGDVTVQPLVSEAVTVTGSAPSIESSPAAGTTTVNGRDVAIRQPSNLMQAVENVAGVNQVSEGQAAVPAVRGLARGRTLILIDGARVTSERRVGPERDVHGSSRHRERGRRARTRLGRVRLRRLRRGHLGADAARRARLALGVRFSGTAAPASRRGVCTARCRRACRRAASCVAVARSRGRRLGQPRAARSSTRASRTAACSRGSSTSSAAGRSASASRATSDATSTGRATTRRPCASTTRTRIRTGSPAATSCPISPASSASASTAFLGTYDQRTDQDRFATATTGRTIERADISANDYVAARASARSCSAARGSRSAST